MGLDSTIGVMIDRPTLLKLIPHQGAMCLWDRVETWDTVSIRLGSAAHRRADHPLREGGKLRAVHLCEYGAQAMAAHGGLLLREAGHVPRAGMLVALRKVELHVARIDDLERDLEGEAELLAAAEGSKQYRFCITHQGCLIAQGRAAVVLDCA